MPTVRAGPWQGCCCVCGRIATAGGRRALRLPVAGVSTEAHARRFQYYPDSRKDRGTHLCAFGVSARGQSPSAARAGTGVDVGAVVVAGVGSGAVHLVCAGSGRGGGAVGSFARVRLGMSGSVVVGWSGRAVCRAGDLDIKAAGRTCASVCSGLFIRRGRGRRIRGLGYSVTVTKVCSWIGNGAPRRQQFPNAERFDVQIAAARRAVVHRRAMLRRTARSLKLLRCLERLYAQQALPLPCLLLI